MSTDIHHLRPKDSGAAVLVWKNLVQLGHLAANRSAPFDENHLMPQISELQTGLNAGDASSYYQRLLGHWHPERNQGFVQLDLLDSHTNKIDSLPSCFVNALGVTPGTLLSDINHLHQIGIDVPGNANGLEGFVVNSWGTSRHYNPIQIVFVNVTDNLCLSSRTHVGMLSNMGDPGFSYGFAKTAAVDRASDIGSTMTDKNSYAIIGHRLLTLLS
jgi:hypothetical protein